MKMIRCFAFILFICCVCSAIMDKYYLKDAAANDGAVCLDGTPGAYYFQAGSEANSTKWVLHVVGGGMCMDDYSCFLRSQTTLGSCIPWPDQIHYGGPLHEDPAYNPDFYDWNHVFLIFCDGASFSGDRDEPVVFPEGTIYYRGHRILLGLIKELKNLRGFDRATDVLFVGDSAGGMATYYHADELRDLMPKSVTRFKAAPFSGMFLDRLSCEGKDFFRKEFQHVYQMQNCSVNKRCEAAYPPDERYKCMFAEYTMEYIESPLFVLNSANDACGIACVVAGEPETEPRGTGSGNCTAAPGWQYCQNEPHQCSDSQWKDIEDYASAFRKLLENNPKFKQNGNGYFEYSCFTHAIEATTYAWFYVEIQGTAMRDAVKRWYFSDNEPSSNHMYKDCINHHSFMCNPTCDYPTIIPNSAPDFPPLYEGY